MNRQGFRVFAVLAFLLQSIVLANPGWGRTVVEQTGPCEYTITLRIEIWGDPRRVIDSEDNKGNPLQIEGAATDEVAALMKSRIESVWNGPTLETAEEITKGLRDAEEKRKREQDPEYEGEPEEEQEEQGEEHEDEHDVSRWEVNEVMRDFGTSNNCVVNCCTIIFTADVRPREGGANDGTPGWHQIQAVATEYEVALEPGLVPGIEDYEEPTIKRFRSYQYRPTGPDVSTTGAWAARSNGAPSAHEVGHMLGLPDTYEDVDSDGDGEVTSVPIEGHEHDLMADSDMFPTTAALEKILEFFGVECDCCPREADVAAATDAYMEGYLQSYALLAGDVGEAMSTCDIEKINQLIQMVKNKIKDIAHSQIPVATKMELYGEMQLLIDRLEQRKKDCDKPPPFDYDVDAIFGDADFLGGTQIEQDGEKWCTYRTDGPITIPPVVFPPIDGGGGTPPVTPPPGGGNPPVPPGGSIPPVPPGDGENPPAKNPCVEELEFLRQLIEDYGEKLKAAASNPALSAGEQSEAAQHLQTLTDRIAELEKICGGDQDGPDDTSGPHAGGGDKPIPAVTLIPGDRGTPGEGGGDDHGDGGDDGDGDTPPETTGGPPDVPEQYKPEDDGSIEEIIIYIKAKEWALTSSGSTATAVAGQKIKLFPPSIADVALPGEGESDGQSKPQAGHDKDPVQATTDENGEAELPLEMDEVLVTGGRIDEAPGAGLVMVIDATEQGSSNVAAGAIPPEQAVNQIPAQFKPYHTDTTKIGDDTYLTFSYSTGMKSSFELGLGYHYEFENVETNFCRDKQAVSSATNEPLYQGNKAWGQKYDNQWAIKRVGLTGERKSAWNELGKKPAKVVVAVIDTGLDWNHQDFNWKNLWRNTKEIPDNGIDDDRNGYVDDTIGWNFYGRNNKPWDHDGHGTLVTGIIAADSGNGIGMAGINPHAEIMVLKALNGFGHTRASFVAKALTYAVDNGARIVNMSVGGKELSMMEQAAVEYAKANNVLVVVASGNEGINIAEFGVSGLPSVLTVGASDRKDKRAVFSNWGKHIDVVAPGVEVLGLRARRTDTMRGIDGVEYKNGANYVGEDKRYYRASGTSFAAPIVTGVASLLLSKDPSLSAEELARMLKQTADDLDTPGVDQLSGHGMINAQRAIAANSRYFVDANISGVGSVQRKGQLMLQISGTADANKFDSATVYIAKVSDGEKWQKVADIEDAVTEGVLAEVDANLFRSAAQWNIRLVSEHRNGKKRETRFRLALQ